MSRDLPSDARPTRRERQAETRAQVVQAARELFLTRGYHGTTLAAVVDAAGFTKGAVYSNFSSKAELAFEVVEAIERENISRLAVAYQKESDGAGRARALTAWGEEILRDTAGVRLRYELNFAAMDDPDLRETMRQKSRNVKSATQYMLSEMDNTDDFLLDLDVLAATFLALSAGVGIQRINDPEFDLRAFVQAAGVLTGTPVERTDVPPAAEGK